MSTTTRKPLAQALAELADFENLIKPSVVCDRWLVCGSVRRKKPDVGDVDIVAIPKFGDMPKADDLFGSPERCNLLWRRVEDLVKLGTFAKFIKDTEAGPRTKWGEQSRAIAFCGTCYEISLAEPCSWAMWCIVRTGPAELSKLFVTQLPRKGYEVKDGFKLFYEGVRVDPDSEEQVFKMSGVPWRRPEMR